MMSEDRPEPPRAVLHFFLPVVVAFAVIVSAFASGRPILLASFNNVAPAGEVPRAMVPEIADDWSVVIHRSDWNPVLAALLGRQGEDRRTAETPRLGWVVREWSFLSLPMGAYRQSDLAAFREDRYGYRLSGFTDEQRARVERAVGTPWFPWWRYFWGWLAVIAVAGFVMAELRWQARRRALLGLI